MTRGIPANENVLIELRHVVKTFKTPAGGVTVLKGINLDFTAGEFAGIVGKSGSGKSTLVNMITGIDHPTGGSVKINGTSLHTLGEGQLAIWRGRMLGVVFQFFQLLPMLTVRENILLPMDLAGHIPWEQRESRVMELLERVGARELADKLPGALSGGQQQTAAIARALANDPPILVADEPTGNLDSVTAESIFAIFQELAAQGKTIIMVTHDMGLANRANRKVILCDGEVIDDHLANVFPKLTHPQLLELTHSCTRRRLAGGEAQQIDSMTNAGLVLVVEGRLDIQPSNAVSGREKPFTITPGQYLFLPSLSDAKPCKIFVPSELENGVNLLEIPGDALERWLAANPTARETIHENAANTLFSPPQIPYGGSSRRIP